MAEEKASKKPVQPHQLKGERVRVCGKWQKKGYKASDEEKKAYERQQAILKSANANIEKINKGTAKK